MATIYPPLGAVFYVWGQHRTVVEHGEWDGQPAVRLLPDRAAKPEPVLTSVKALLTHGSPSKREETTDGNDR